MKKTVKILSLYLMTAATLASCSGNDSPDDNEGLSQKEMAISRAADEYVDNTVLPTYKDMADAAIELHDLCLAIQSKHEAGTLTGADIKSAGESWKNPVKAGNCRRLSFSDLPPTIISTRISTLGLSTRPPWMIFLQRYGAERKTGASTTTADMAS